MPLIHDNPWLVEQLLKAAQAATPTPPPPSTNPVPNQQQVADALRALLQNLKTVPSMSGVRQGAGDAAVDLAAPHMASMGDFVEWLDSNKTQIDGVQIVYPGNGAHPAGDDYGYFRIEPGTKAAVNIDDKGARPTLPSRTEVRYWINTEALKKYLVTLQGDQKLRNNPTFQLQLLHLIRFANEQLDVGMNEKYKEETPDQQVDNLPSVLDMKNWASPGNANPLWLRDLKSPQDLNAWFGSKNIGVKTENGKTVTIRDQDWDGCAAIQVLGKRAFSLQSRATPQSAKAAAAYVTAMQGIAKAINCNLSGSGGSGGGSGSGDGSGGSGAPVDLASIATLLPFDANNIDFRQILAFADNYASWAQANSRPEIAAAAKQIHTSVDQANRVLATPNMVIQISNLSGQRPNRNTPSSFEVLCKNANQAITLANFLTSIVSIGGRMLQDFAVVFERGYGAAAARPVKQNIGPQQTNLADLREILSHLQRPGPGM